MATTASGIEAARELDELYREHAAEVFRYTYAVLGNRADAEDVTQTTFVNALRALERGERPHTPKNWLITIAHNLIRQRFRQQQTRPREVELDHELPAAEADDDGPSLDDLVRALQRIPPTQRQALVLRELEGRSYVEIAALLEISQSALETLIFRARRSLADELENLVTCDGAELALSRESDGRLGRKERRRLLAHLDECASCARIAARSMKHRRAFKVLALLPLPFSLTLFKGAPTASAAAGLPTIGAGAGATAGAAAGVGAAGVSAKIAVGLAAVAVAGGAGYEGVKVVGDAPSPARVAKVEKAQAAPVPARPVIRASTPVAKTGVRPARPLPGQAANPPRGKSAVAPGQIKTQRRATPKRGKSAVAPGRIKTQQRATPTRGRSAVAPGQVKSQQTSTTRPVKKEKTTFKAAAVPRQTKPAQTKIAVLKRNRPAKPKPDRAAVATKAEKPAKRATPGLSAKPPAAPAGQDRAKPEKVG